MYILCHFLLFLLTVEPYLYFRFVCLPNIINKLFPLRNPINCDILICGGILTNICISSAHAPVSIIFIPFYSQYFSYLFFSFIYISFRLYFCANTIWYRHLYFEWAILLISFVFFFDIAKTLHDIFLVTRSPNLLLLYHGRFSHANAFSHT